MGAQEANTRWVGELPSLRVVTWNTRALLAADALEVRRSVAVARELALGADALMLQECHGCRASLAVAFADLRQAHTVWGSAGRSVGEGGVQLLIRRGLLADARRASHMEIIPGGVQAVRVEWAAGAGALTLVNMHNFGWTPIEKRRPRRFSTPKPAARRVGRAALYDHFGRRHEFWHDSGRGHHRRHGGGVARRSAAKHRFPRPQDDASPRGNRTQRGGLQGEEGDGIWRNSLHRKPARHILCVRIPEVCFAQLQTTCRVHDSMAIRERDISDHFPVAIQMAMKQEAPRAQRPVPHWPTRRREFKGAVQSRLNRL